MSTGCWKFFASSPPRLLRNFEGRPAGVDFDFLALPSGFALLLYSLPSACAPGRIHSLLRSCGNSCGGFHTHPWLRFTGIDCGIPILRTPRRVGHPSRGCHLRFASQVRDVAAAKLPPFTAVPWKLRSYAAGSSAWQVAPAIFCGVVSCAALFTSVWQSTQVNMLPWTESLNACGSTSD